MVIISSLLLRQTFFPAIENLAIGQWVRSRDPMFMRMSHATETDFLAEMVNDVFEFGISKDIERPEGEKGRYKKEGYERLKKALARLAGINDEEKSNESSDT